MGTGLTANFKLSVFAVLVLSLCIPPRVQAGEPDTSYSRNAIYVEGLGAGVLYSVNYDRRITPDFSVRVGFSSWSIGTLLVLGSGELSYTSFPVTASYLYGNGASHLELGLGLVPGYVSITGGGIFFGKDVTKTAGTLLGTAIVGYRLQPNDGGIFFRIGFTPLFTFRKFQPWGGLSIGASF